MFKEFSILFVQIESMLNGYPLCPLNFDPNYINVLTPGHFDTRTVKVGSRRRPDISQYKSPRPLAIDLML